MFPLLEASGEYFDSQVLRLTRIFAKLLSEVDIERATDLSKAIIFRESEVFTMLPVYLVFLGQPELVMEQRPFGQGAAPFAGWIAFGMSSAAVISLFSGHATV